MSKPKPKPGRKRRIIGYGFLITLLVFTLMDLFGTMVNTPGSLFDRFSSICYEGSSMPTESNPSPTPDKPCRCWGYQKLLRDDRPIDGNASFACYGIRQ